MYGGGVLSASWLWFASDAGNTSTFWISSLTPSVEEFIHLTNFAASAGCFEFAVTASVSPPQMPTVGSPAVQAGSGAAVHLPAVSLAMDGSWLGAHCALTQPMMVPLSMSVLHCGDQLGSGLTRPCWIRPLQKLATFWVAASSMATFHVVPDAVHQLAPACCASPANQPESAAEKL